MSNPHDSMGSSGSPEAAAKLAEDCTKAGDKAGAGRHLARAGGLLLAEGRADEALRAFSSSIELAPDDIEGREGHVQSLWAANRPADAIARTDDLAQRYLALGLPGRAKRALERALAREERTSTMDLLVKAFVKLRQPKAAVEAGERLVNRLRGEGRGGQARAVAASLMAVAGDADRERLIRAAGADRRKVAVMLAVTVALGVALLPASKAYASREAYKGTLGEVRSALEAAGDLGRTETALATVEGLLREHATEGGAVGEHAALTLEQVKRVLTDVKAVKAAQFTGALPWQTAPDLLEAERRLVAMQPTAGVYLQAPLRSTLEAIAQFKGSGDELRERLMHMEPGPEAMALAMRLRSEFRALPALLASSEVRICVDTRPSGAKVRWGGIEFRSKTTPIDLTLPILGEGRELVVSREGHEPLTRTVQFDGQMEPTIVLELKPRAAPPPRPRPVTPTPTTPTPTTPEPRPDAPTGVTSTPKPVEPAPTRDPTLQVEFRDAWRDAEDPRFRFEPSPRLFADLTLEARYQCTLESLNVVEGNAVSLVGLRAHIQVRTSGGWRDEPPTTITFEPKRRPMRSEGPNLFKVDTVTRTLHLESPTWLREQAQELLEDAVRVVKIRERDRQRGGR